MHASHHSSMTVTIARLLKVDLNDLVRIEAVPDPVVKLTEEEKNEE